jgi:hypothetical protein
MRPQDIVIGTLYRFRTHPNYSYAKALEVIPAKTGVNTNSYKVVKCEHTVSRNDTFGFIRYFRPCDLVKDTTVYVK